LQVFVQKPVPIQVTYLGYPCTTGLSTIDYRLVDEVTAPLGEPICDSEELFRLPVPFACYCPAPNAPEVGPLPAERSGRITFGSLHKLEKLNPAVLDLWSLVLRDTPSSRLLLARNTLDAASVQRLTAQFQERGVPADRLAFSRIEPVNMEHLRSYADIDIALDAFPWNGHTTACESLWMGVPVVGLRGRRHSARMTASVLTSLRLEELVAKDACEYRRIAARLAADVQPLSRLRSELRARMATSPLCDGAAFTRNLEAAYRTMWRRWCASRVRKPALASAHLVE
jgi:protein O-GlcNAc transferase